MESSVDGVVIGDYLTMRELTAKEMEIVKLLPLGLTNKQIAEKLGISPQTVRNRLNVIYLKLNVKNRTQAAVFKIEGING